MLAIGLVGATGAGKTEVLRLFEQHGAVTIAADELSREVLAPGAPALQLVREKFGDDYFDAQGHLIRKALGSLIFCDETARRRLDAIVHPLMTDLLRKQLDQWRQEGVPVAVVESAVLEEMGARPLVDVVVRVEAGESVRRQRLQQRDALTEDEARQRLSAHERLGLAETVSDFVINNDGDPQALRKQVEQIWLALVETS